MDKESKRPSVQVRSNPENLTSDAVGKPRYKNSSIKREVPQGKFKGTGGKKKERSVNKRKKSPFKYV